MRPRTCGAIDCELLVAACIPWHYYDRRLLYLAVPVALLAAVAVYGAISRPPEWLQHPVLLWFGTISYGLYLWHYMVISLPWENLRPVPPLFSMIVAPIALAWLSWHFIEAPLLRRRPAHRTALQSS